MSKTWMMMVTLATRHLAPAPSRRRKPTTMRILRRHAAEDHYALLLAADYASVS